MSDIQIQLTHGEYQIFDSMKYEKLRNLSF